MSENINKKRSVPIKQLEIFSDKVTDLTDFISHVRINQKVKLLLRCDFPDNVRIRVDSKDLSGCIENNTALVKDGLAMFHNLRFKCSSGRGHLIDLTIQIDTFPEKELICKNFLKITRDGPRVRKKNKNLDSNSIGDISRTESNCSNEFDEDDEMENSLPSPIDYSQVQNLPISKEKYENYIKELNEFTRHFVTYNNSMGNILNIDEINQVIQQVSLKMIKNICD